MLEFSGYGCPRVTKALGRAGYLVNHKRVLRIIREESLLCQLKVWCKGFTPSEHIPRTPILVTNKGHASSSSPESTLNRCIHAYANLAELCDRMYLYLTYEAPPRSQSCADALDHRAGRR